MENVSGGEVSLDDRQMDALRELANIGCGHAASALSKLLGGSPVGIEVPRAKLMEVRALCDHFGGPSMPMVAVSTEVAGGLSGLLAVLMRDRDARTLAGLLLGSLPAGPLSEEARSAICEAGNIVGSACLGAIARALSLELMPSVPRFAQDSAASVLASALEKRPGSVGRALVLETRFIPRQHQDFAGHFLIIPDLPSLSRILGAMGL